MKSEQINSQINKGLLKQSAAWQLRGIALWHVIG